MQHISALPYNYSMFEYAGTSPGLIYHLGISISISSMFIDCLFLFRFSQIVCLYRLAIHNLLDK